MVSKKPASALKANAKSVTYNGKAQKPKVTVKDGSYKLKNGTDYTVKYSGNKKIGKGTKVGAGSVVIGNDNDDASVMGVPAKVLRF